MISDIKISELTQNKYIHPIKIEYIQNGQSRIWEAVKSHDSVAVLIYHTTKDAFLLVKQFRPPIITNKNNTIKDAFTYELCAGLCDKEKSLEEITAEEIDEECGYKVHHSDLEFITSFHTCVGISGAMQHLFYATINEDLRIHSGGGDNTEQIELVWLQKSEAKQFILDTTKPKTPGLGLAIYWWFGEKA